MDWHQLITIAAEVGLTPLNIILTAMVVILMNHLGISIKFWEKKDEKPATRAQMDRLSNYYNHDTTELLTSIDSGIKEVRVAVEKLEDSVRELHNHHSEWEKFGIPIREKK